MDIGKSEYSTKDFFASPALSLSLAGVFRAAAENDEDSEGREEAVEISSENTGPLAGLEEDLEDEGNHEEDDREDFGDDKNRKKRKKYHRHTAQQIKEMEALFKDSPHPDEKQRQKLSKQLGLSPRQVKFWFQNRRTQIKAIQERHENSLLKSEMEKLREENQCLRETIKKACCLNCGIAYMSKDSPMATEEQQLRIENATLKAEIEKLRRMPKKVHEETATPSSSRSSIADQNIRTSINGYAGNFGLEKPKILQIVSNSLEELTQMAAANEPLWHRSLETGREILNYEEYLRMFAPKITSSSSQAKSVEASRETGIVFLDINRLIQAFMDVNQWKEMFSCMISRASIVDVIAERGGDSLTGLVQLMFVELQMLTPTVPTREYYFIRHCKQLSHDQWAILDVSMDEVENFRKRASGCIIEDKGNGHCKVIWVEHIECRKNVIPMMYRSIVNSGLAFGARHWMETLRLQCERMVFLMATNIPTKDCSGVTTLAGRKSILRLAQRMCTSFCHAVGASRNRMWTKFSTRFGDDIRITLRKNISDPGEPVGVILCAVSSIWLHVSSMVLFNFLRDESRRTEGGIGLYRGPTQTIVNLVKGKDHGNSVTVHALRSTEKSSVCILQDSCTNAYESMVVFAPVETEGMQSVLNGCDSSNMIILPSGFSILPDGLDSRPLVIKSRAEKRDDDGGSLLTIAFQILASASPTAKVAIEDAENVNALVSCALHNIKKSFQCEDG